MEFVHVQVVLSLRSSTTLYGFAISPRFGDKLTREGTMAGTKQGHKHLKMMVLFDFLIPNLSFLWTKKTTNSPCLHPFGPPKFEKKKRNSKAMKFYVRFVSSSACWGCICRETNFSKASLIHQFWHASLASATVIYKIYTINFRTTDTMNVRNLHTIEPESKDVQRQLSMYCNSTYPFSFSGTLLGPKVQLLLDKQREHVPLTKCAMAFALITPHTQYTLQVHRNNGWVNGCNSLKIKLDWFRIGFADTHSKLANHTGFL